VKTEIKKRIFRISGMILTFLGMTPVVIPALIMGLSKTHKSLFPDFLIKLVDFSGIYFFYLFCFILSVVMIYIGVQITAVLGCEWQINELDDGVYIVTTEFRSNLRLIAKKDDLHNEEKRITLVDRYNSLPMDTTFQVHNGRLQKFS